MKYIGLIFGVFLSAELSAAHAPDKQLILSSTADIALLSTIPKHEIVSIELRFLDEELLQNALNSLCSDAALFARTKILSIHACAANAVAIEKVLILARMNNPWTIELSSLDLSLELVQIIGMYENMGQLSLVQVDTCPKGRQELLKKVNNFINLDII